jgi:hypothetical protein
MPQGVPIQKTLTLRTWCTIDNAASTRRRCPKERWLKKYFPREHSVRPITQRLPWGGAPRSVYVFFFNYSPWARSVRPTTQRPPWGNAPRSVYFRKYFPREHSVRPTTQRPPWRGAPRSVYLKNTTLEYTAYVPQHSVLPEEMPQGVSMLKILASRTQRASRNTASSLRSCLKECSFKQVLPLSTQHTSYNTVSSLKRCPKECLFRKYFPWVHSVRPTTQRPQWGDAPRSVYFENTSLEHTAYVPQHSVHYEEMP